MAFHWGAFGARHWDQGEMLDQCTYRRRPSRVALPDGPDGGGGPPVPFTSLMADGGGDTGGGKGPTPHEDEHWYYDWTVHAYQVKPSGAILWGYFVETYAPDPKRRRTRGGPGGMHDQRLRDAVEPIAPTILRECDQGVGSGSGLGVGGRRRDLVGSD